MSQTLATIPFWQAVPPVSPVLARVMVSVADVDLAFQDLGPHFGRGFASPFTVNTPGHLQTGAPDTTQRSSHDGALGQD